MKCDLLRTRFIPMINEELRCLEIASTDASVRFDVNDIPKDIYEDNLADLKEYKRVLCKLREQAMEGEIDV